MAEQAEFEQERSRLWGIAYRITGSVADAEDAVQDAWLRWQALPDGAADSPRAYLTTVVSRLCYDRLTSARARRETYTGTWLPEPVVTQDGPEERVTLDESVGTALLTVLERLTPAERTAFVLHDVFAVPFGEIAEAVGRTPEAVRRLASRARHRVRDEAPRRTVDRAEHRRAVDAFLAAAAGADFGGLLDILDPDVVWRSDGGGKVIAARLPVTGREKVAHFIEHVVRRDLVDRVRIVVRDINGAPGAIAVDRESGVLATYAFTVDQGRITSIDAVLNPDKLSHIAPDALH
ncbi:RNA polymerase sigma factor SigJ [Streptomyces clavuligerus]|uniref:Sigma-24 n=1 Tax=Streptomyces clavuligerus TaxID=1901 RepID=B5H3Z7_STRCL|nr:RNA polymerase sigma factor SigJ [Streptomyces clavuligerus]ANW19724.1 siderophore-interacting protein [Streptomyces clavuligerus]AXU14337.1 sigma-70 family RNA polymerase sigma factor [Streptomyces clavuligerus]EDY53293.1 sigma-24 [Streptomyces clavuligerus]EFG07435.1 sigma-24 [Streptomyces clavuligerus]MBY6304340.1 RNA polymerase sigma factor SigJ [Streptomyces clavuligerus]